MTNCSRSSWRKIQGSWIDRATPLGERRAGIVDWTLIKGDKRIDARLLVHGKYGVEVQPYRDGGFYGGWRFNLRSEAIAYGDVLREDLEARRVERQPAVTRARRNCRTPHILQR